MMSRLSRWWQDWRRGYTNDDYRSALRKICGEHRPGAIIFVTAGEQRAMIALRRGE